jgi:phage baseplate assembly protein V
MWGQVDQRIRSALRGIRLAFRGRLTRVKSDLIIQQVQVKGLAGEQLQDAEFFQHFGFTSCPPAGTQCIVLPMGGQTSHAIIIATENGAYRIQNLASGEVAIYSSEGAYVHIKKGVSLRLTAMNSVLKRRSIRLRRAIMLRLSPQTAYQRRL